MIVVEILTYGKIWFTTINNWQETQHTSCITCCLESDINSIKWGM